MKKLLLLAVLLVTIWPGAARAQDLTGTWQGTLAVARPLRLVIKIAAEGGGLRAVMYSIDQGGQGVASSAVAVQGGSLKITIAAAGVAYEGKLGPDGNSIAGTFTQGGNPIALNLVRATADTAWAIPAPPAAAAPMPPDAHPVFEVATIKPSDPNAQGKGFTMRGRQVMTINTTVNDLISFAYGVHARQITGGPAWLDADHFNVTGQPDVPGLPNVDQMRMMVEKLLTDRFKLTFHREKKELPVYALVVGSKGPTLTRSESTINLPSLMFRGLGNLPARNATMGDFAGVMQSAVLDRPVVDQTGLTGRYDFSLVWTPDETQFGAMGVKVPPPPPDSTTPGLFTAIQQQLGLKFDATRAPVETIAIDRIERPTEN